MSVFTHGILGTRLTQHATSQIKGLLARWADGCVRAEMRRMQQLCEELARAETSVLLWWAVHRPSCSSYWFFSIIFLFIMAWLHSPIGLRLVTLPMVCHGSSGCLATGSCLSQQVATMTVARWEPSNKDIRCYLPLLVCRHFIDLWELQCVFVHSACVFICWFLLEWSVTECSSQRKLRSRRLVSHKGQHTSGPVRRVVEVKRVREYSRS